MPRASILTFNPDRYVTYLPSTEASVCLQIFATMRSFILLALFCLVGWSSSQNCPAQYLRFTPQHTFCLSPNPTCHVIHRGVTPQDKELILKLHNQFRSKTAMGDEDRAMDGSLPQAADMMQMEWDDELAAIAQKWTENCEYGHDCNECKAVENFFVGQNIAMQNFTACYGHSCPEPSDENMGLMWTGALTAFYDEVKYYYVDWLDSFVEHPGPVTEHLTQLIWSTSWRVGCGFSFYKQGTGYYSFYACNYGPGGNLDMGTVYKQGRPCTACPTNTQCSTSVRGPNTYPGLCKMINPNTAPAYSSNYKDLLFHCGASPSDPDCKAKVSGDGTWKTVRSVGGNYNSIVLSGGQSTSITFKSPIKKHSKPFCLFLIFRKGPLDASRGDASIFKANYKMKRLLQPPMELQPNTTSFTRYGMTLLWGSKTKLGFTFSVPRGAGPHVLDIRKIEAYDGPCHGSE